MPFPISASGAITLDTQMPPDLDLVIRTVRFALEDAEPSRVSEFQQQVKFRAGPFRFTHSWNILAPITSGTIDFSTNDRQIVMRYRISFTEALVLSGGFLAFVLFVLKQSFPAGVAIAFLVWLASVALIYFVSILRFHTFMQETVERAISPQNAQTGA